MSVRALRRGTMAGRGVPPPNVLYLSLPGTSGNYASTPDTAANSITGDMDVRVKLAMADWTVAPFYALMSKWDNAGPRSWVFYNNGSGILRFVGFNGGSAVGVNSSAAVPFADGATGWVKVTKTATATKFWTSTDGSSWTQLGTDQAAITVVDSTALVEVGGQTQGTGGPLLGSVYKAELRNGVDGTLVNVFDATTVTKTATRTPTTVVASTGETWTMNGSAWDWVT